MSPLPAPRRIVTSNLAVPEGLNKVDNSEPAVEVVSEELPLVSELGGLWFGRPVFTHEKVPTSNTGTDITVKPIPNGGLCFPHGANVRYNEIPPGGKAPMGSMVLITPDEAYDPGTSDVSGKLRETVCNVGDIVVQRGTLHAWENRSGEWARFISVLIASEDNTVDRAEGTSQKLEESFKMVL
ncbi:hypothetical protein KVR01_005772 [Diaporthe batatas]|uniref:uncharacterized protein n=1 Tax=Diaporthe batatas TaxID=748121 RepID=UPI001D044BDC|nr:uncharacterized protein KVR01_005772 [Diaporthe batatas]KAG8163854.1 hypothetical protein KVR01_005772 [Diaporthe batatas]